MLERASARQRTREGGCIFADACFAVDSNARGPHETINIDNYNY